MSSERLGLFARFAAASRYLGQDRSKKVASAASSEVKDKSHHQKEGN
jgi:hypothetical protein